MRFSAAIQLPASGMPVPAARPLPPAAEAQDVQPPQQPLPPFELPLDLDQRVRLTGEW